MFLSTLALMFMLHAASRMLAELFVPLLAAGAIFVEEKLPEVHWGRVARAGVLVYLLVGGFIVAPSSLPILPVDQLPDLTYQPIKEFNGLSARVPVILAGRIGWDEFVQEVARVYDDLPAEDRAVAGIYTDWYMPAGAIDQLGPQYGLPHAVSGHLTYYLWGPGYSWDVMIILTGKTNNMSVFFDECELKAVVQNEVNSLMPARYIFVCRKPKMPADTIWSSAKSFR
jgi:hypothetical protein